MVRAMDRLLVTCPETSSREEIDCITARDGEILVILRCSRFDPPEATTCNGACAHCTNELASAHRRDPWLLPWLG